MSRLKERTGVYFTGERQLEITGAWRRARGQIPIVFCHGFLADGWTLRRGAPPATQGRDYFRPWDLVADALGTVVLSADLGGPSTWANDTAISRVDTLLTWAGSNLFTRTDRVIICGDSMGTLLALNWAWRNHVKVVAVWLRAPITRLDDFHDRNADPFAPVIEAAYTNLAGYTAALPTHDPAQNMAALSILGPKTLLHATINDELIPPDEVALYSATTGALARYAPGNHGDNVRTEDVPVVVEWLSDRIKAA